MKDMGGESARLIAAERERHDSYAQSRRRTPSTQRPTQTFR